MMPKRPMPEETFEPKPAVKRAPRRPARPKKVEAQVVEKPVLSASADVGPTPVPPPPPRAEAGLSRRSLIFAGLGVFAGGAALGLGAAKLATPEGVAAASRKIVASAPVWFVEEEPLPSEIHLPVAPRVAEFRPPEVKPVEPKLAEPRPVAPPPPQQQPSTVGSTPAAPVVPAVPAAPRAAPRPTPSIISGDGRPTVAIVIDDVGVDRARGERVLSLPSEVTIAFMTYAETPRQWGERARASGHEYLVHVPMQPTGNVDPGPQALLGGLDGEELRRRLRWGLDRWDGYVGANNHMGSRFTESMPGMSLVMEEMRSRGLLFLDSRTSAKSVAGQAAQQAAVPFAERNIFLDNDATPAGVQRQLAAFEDLARKRGQAIAIGHPHDATLAALASWVPAAQARGIRVVPLTKVMHHA